MTSFLSHNLHRFYVLRLDVEWATHLTALDLIPDRLEVQLTPTNLYYFQSASNFISRKLLASGRSDCFKLSLWLKDLDGSWDYYQLRYGCFCRVNGWTSVGIYPMSLFALALSRSETEIKVLFVLTIMH